MTRLLELRRFCSVTRQRLGAGQADAAELAVTDQRIVDEAFELIDDHQATTNLDDFGNDHQATGDVHNFAETNAVESAKAEDLAVGQVM